jgi:hypothetical protein
MITAIANQLGINTNAAISLVTSDTFNTEVIKEDLTNGLYDQWHYFINQYTDTLNNNYEEELLQSLIEVGVKNDFVGVRISKKELIKTVADPEFRGEIIIGYKGLIPTTSKVLIITKQQFNNLSLFLLDDFYQKNNK